MEPQCYKTKFLSVNTLTLAHTRSLVTSGVLSEAPQKCFRALHATHTQTPRKMQTDSSYTDTFVSLPAGEGTDWDCCKCPCWPCLPVDLGSALVLVLSLVLRALLRQI